MVKADLTPSFPAQHRRAVDQHDALEVWLGARVKERIGTRQQHSGRIGWVMLAGRNNHPLRDVAFGRVEDSGEQLGLVGELVVQRTPTHVGLPRDPLSADRSETFGTKQPTRRSYQRSPGRRGAFGLAATRWRKR